MKKKFFSFCFLIVSIILLGACSDNDEDSDEVIPTSNFILGTPYVWKLPMNEDVFYVVNSSTEMYQYIETIDGSEVGANIPDFEKYTLLVGNVRTTSGISKIETKLIKHNDVDYTFEIYVFTNDATIAENRIVAVTVPKLPNNAKVVKKDIVQPDKGKD